MNSHCLTQTKFQNESAQLRNISKLENPFENHLRNTLKPFPMIPDLNVKKKEELHETILKIKREKIVGKQKHHKNMKMQFKIVNKELVKALVKIRELDALEILMQKSASIIQRVYRGYRARKALEHQMLEAKRETTKVRITTMDADHDHLMYDVGKMPEISAILIQQTYRRYKKRSYFLRLLETYNLLEAQKKERNYDRIREKLRVFYAICQIRERNFEKFKRIKLKLIKEKLAFLTIKKVFKSLELKFTIILEKIKKYKRRLRAAQKRRKRRETLGSEDLQNIEDVTENQSSLSINSEEDFETTTSDREAEERARVLKKLEEERKLKIFYGKISYNFREIKIPKILTTLHQKEHSFLTTETPPLLPTPSPIRKVPRAKNLEPKRRRYNLDGPSYMRATVSSNMSKWDVKPDFPNDFLSSSPQVQPRNPSTLFLPTKAYLSKVRERRALSIDSGDIQYIDHQPSSPDVITVTIQEKKGKKNSSVYRKQKGKMLTKPKENHVFESTLPEISTRYQHLTVNVKPRTETMKGLSKARKAQD